MTDTKDKPKITHVWPYSKFFNLEAQPVSDEREPDVWEELRGLTFNDDLPGNIAVATHTPEQDDRDAFLNELKKEDVVLSRVKFFASREVELEIHHPATEAYSFKRLRSVAEVVKGPDGEATDNASPIEVPAEAAHTETRLESIPFHL